MTRYTNISNLPQPIFDAVAGDPYSRGASADISVTSLIDSPRLEAIKEKHKDEIVEDVAGMSRSLIGKAVHAMMAENSDGPLDDKTRLFMDVTTSLGTWRVSGQTDYYHDGVIGDFKTIGIYEWKRGLRKERERQLNVYAELLRANGYEVVGLEAYCFLVDWTPRRAMYEKHYPDNSIVTIKVPLWEPDVAGAYIISRVEAHQAARKELPLCDDSDKWAEPTYAVMREGGAKAHRVVESEQEANEIADEKGSDYFVEERQGETVRCRWYCPVSGLCEQYAAEG